MTKTVTETPSDPFGGALNRRVFDKDKLEQGVMNVLTGTPPNGYGIAGVTDLNCPENQPVTAGTSFTCELMVNGSAQQVTVQIKDDNGLYEVNPPS